MILRLFLSQKSIIRHAVKNPRHMADLCRIVCAIGEKHIPIESVNILLLTRYRIVGWLAMKWGKVNFCYTWGGSSWIELNWIDILYTSRARFTESKTLISNRENIEIYYINLDVFSIVVNLDVFSIGNSMFCFQWTGLSMCNLAVHPGMAAESTYVGKLHVLIF